MSTNKLIIFGILDLAELAHYYISKDTEYEIIGFTVNKDFITNNFFTPKGSTKKYPVYPFEDLELSFPPSEHLLFAPMTKIYIMKVNVKGIVLYLTFHQTQLLMITK